MTQPKAVIQPRNKPNAKRIKSHQRNAERAQKRREEYQLWADGQRWIAPQWKPKPKRKYRASRPVADLDSPYNRQIERLKQFASQFAHAHKPAVRLKLLQEMAELKFGTIAPKFQPLIRAEFDKNKRNWLKLKGICAVCYAVPNVRHHIVQIQNGGLNNPKNLMLLCNPCHAKIHPWLQ
jgi:hypothetical protein